MKSALQQPDKLREVVHLVANGMNIDVTTVYNGKEGWIKASYLSTEEPLQHRLTQQMVDIRHGRV